MHGSIPDWFMLMFVVLSTWWVVPVVVSFLALAWAFFWPIRDNNFMGGAERVFLLGIALGIIALTWVLAAFLK